MADVNEWGRTLLSLAIIIGIIAFAGYIALSVQNTRQQEMAKTAVICDMLAPNQCSATQVCCPVHGFARTDIGRCCDTNCLQVDQDGKCIQRRS